MWYVIKLLATYWCLRLPQCGDNERTPNLNQIWSTAIRVPTKRQSVWLQFSVGCFLFLDAKRLYILALSCMRVTVGVMLWLQKQDKTLRMFIQQIRSTPATHRMPLDSSIIRHCSFLLLGEKFRVSLVASSNPNDYELVKSSNEQKCVHACVLVTSKVPASNRLILTRRGCHCSKYIRA